MRWKTARKLFPASRRDTLICIGILSLAMLLCSMLRFLSEGDVYAALIFETAVIFVSRYTNGYLYGLVSSVIGVIGSLTFLARSNRMQPAKNRQNRRTRARCGGSAGFI